MRGIRFSLYGTSYLLQQRDGLGDGGLADGQRERGRAEAARARQRAERHQLAQRERQPLLRARRRVQRARARARVAAMRSWACTQSLSSGTQCTGVHFLKLQRRWEGHRCTCCDLSLYQQPW